MNFRSTFIAIKYVFAIVQFIDKIRKKKKTKAIEERISSTGKDYASTLYWKMYFCEIEEEREEYERWI